jgi:hypothetical protein
MINLFFDAYLVENILFSGLYDFLKYQILTVGVSPFLENSIGTFLHEIKQERGDSNALIYCLKYLW